MFIVVRTEGKFLGVGGDWVSEYPDARKFSTLYQAERTLEASERFYGQYDEAAAPVSVEDYTEGKS